jgi:hypothetical protein
MSQVSVTAAIKQTTIKISARTYWKTSCEMLNKLLLITGENRTEVLAIAMRTIKNLSSSKNCKTIKFERWLTEACEQIVFVTTDLNAGRAGSCIQRI